jgi:hypothetical protein
VAAVAMKSGHLHAVHAWSHGSACIAVLRRFEATPDVCAPYAAHACERACVRGGVAFPSVYRFSYSIYYITGNFSAIRSQI